MQEHKNKNTNKSIVLSIHVHVNGFSFFVHNTSTHKGTFFHKKTFDTHVNVEALHEEIYSELKEQKLLDLQFKEVRCSVENNLATLVPKSLFEESSLHEYVKKDIAVKDNDFVTYDVVPNADWITVYVPFVNINNMLLDTFGTFKYYHAISVWLSSLSNHKSADGELVWSLYKENNHLHIALLRDKKLQFYNCFEADNPKDVVYYVLLTAEKNNVSPNEVPLFICGDMAGADETYLALYEFVRSLNFLKLDNDIQFSSRRINTHQDFCLLNLF